MKRNVINQSEAHLFSDENGTSCILRFLKLLKKNEVRLSVREGYVRDLSSHNQTIMISDARVALHLKLYE